MSDNLRVLDADSLTKTVSTDEIGGVHHPRSKMEYGVDGEAIEVSATNPLPVAVSGEVETISHFHEKMHDGLAYFIKTWLENAGGTGTSDYFSFTAPNTADRIHARVHLAPDVDFTMEIYEDATVSGGTPVPGKNCDRNSANTALLTALAAPTIDVAGDLLWAARTGGGKNAVGVAPGLNYEIIAKQGSTYVFKITKNIAQAGIVDIDFFWYEELTP